MNRFRYDIVCQCVSIVLVGQLAGGCRGATVPPPATVTASPYSFTAVERMSDEEYWTLISDGMATIVSGHAWGEHLLKFMQMNARLGSAAQVEATAGRRDQNLFWVAVHPPTRDGREYYYRDDIRAIMIPRIPIDPVIGGAILAHELQHAYDRIMSEETQEFTYTNLAFIEMQAYRLSIDLIDNYLEGAFTEAARQVVERREFKRQGAFYEPNARGRARLDQLFGAPSPWENQLRTPLYCMAVSYAAAETIVERTYATARYKGFRPTRLEYDYSQPGLFFAQGTGQTVMSPIEGRVVDQVGPGLTETVLRGVVIRGTGPDSALTVRLVGIRPRSDGGAVLQQGDPVGTVQNPRPDYRFLAPGVFLELYRDGIREQEPKEFARERWPGQHFGPRQAGRGSTSLPTVFRELERGAEAEEKRQWTRALDRFQRALTMPSPWHPLPERYHLLARTLAVQERYDEAARVQQQLVNLLEQELAAVQGALPHADLGPIVVYQSERALNAKLLHHRANLESYRAGRGTIYVY